MTESKYYSDNDTGFFCPICKSPVIFDNDRNRLVCPTCIKVAERTKMVEQREFILEHYKKRLIMTLQQSIGRVIPDTEAVEIFSLLEGHFVSKGDT